MLKNTMNSGQLLNNRYQIEGLISQGGMAAVYRATDLNLSRVVAIKVIHPHLSQDVEFVRRFEKEAKSIAQLRHPNIIQIFDYNHDEGIYYIVLEFVAGETLQSRLQRLHNDNRTLDQVEAVHIAASMADALEYAHSQGAIHRDVKPSNVLLNTQGDAILTDFGIVKMMGETQHTATGAVLGTARYMSPEQIKGRRIDSRTDIYSLGVMLFEMVGSRPPFESDSVMTIMMMHVSDPVPDLFQICPDVQVALVDVINKALAKDPEVRYQTAAELATALRQLGVVTQSADATVLMDDSSDQPMILNNDEQVPGKAMETFYLTQKTYPWLKWVGAVVILLGLFGGGYAIFGGGKIDGSDQHVTSETVEPNAQEIVVKATESPTKESVSEVQIGLTAIPTNTTEPTATATFTPMPTETPTRDPYQLPVNPMIGDSWIRRDDEMKMMYVPSGTFPMGSNDRQDDEKPVHDVTLDSFWIDQTEVTNEQFARFVAETNYVTIAEEKGTGWIPKEEGGWVEIEGVNWQHPSGPDSNLEGLNQHPVVQISWYDAEAYCEWVGGHLPTEAEWEYAASGTQGWIYPWGNEFKGQNLNFCDTNCSFDQKDDSVDDGYERTAPVHSYLAGDSWVGASDMAGNVWEWVNDWYADDYYAASPSTNPTGAIDSEFKVLRGGSWDNNAGNTRAANRSRNAPAGRTSVFGFRCAVSDK